MSSTTLVNVDRNAEAGPSSHAFGQRATTSESPKLEDVVRRIRNAKRIVVICGAGVSTAASIPDFRSASGLFTGAKGLGVKDLFHVKSLGSPDRLTEHHALLTDLSERATKAQPTPFHSLLATLDGEERLLRCYTQNIDGLEARAGLRTGVPHNHPKSPSRRGKSSIPSSNVTSGTSSPALGEIGNSLNPEPFQYPPAPRCIPLHGLLDTLLCTLCKTTVPLDDHLPLPPNPIPCPTCDLSSSLRSALSERQRRSGILRAGVVLYGEEHPEGDLIGSVVERDLRGTGRRGEKEGRVDLLLVAGTSLSIPGVKRIVKEMSKALSHRPDSSVRDGKASPIRTVYINDEPPAKPAEWEGVFDVWAQGDVQALAGLVADETYAPPIPITPKTPRTPKKNKDVKDVLPLTPKSMTPKTPKRKRVEEGTPTKKRKAPPTPRATPVKEEREREREVSPSPMGRDSSSF